MKEIETSILSNVCGAAGRATPSPSASAAADLNPFNYWANVWSNAMVFTPPFGTTPLFPTPFH